MTDNNDINIRINYETDESSAARARKSVDAVEAKITGIGKAARVTDRELDALGKDIRQNFDKATDSVGKLSDEIRRDLVGAIREADNASARAGRAGGGIDTDFAGRAASTSAGLRGAADAFSGGNSGAVGGLLEFTEAIADVGEFAPQAASQVLTLAGSLGPVGIGLAAVVAIAAAAVVAASQSIQKEADRITQVGEERLALAERIAAGLSTDEALTEIEANNRRRVEIDKERIRAEQEYNDFLAQQPDVVGKLGDNLLKVFDAREAAFEKTVNDANAKLKEIDTSNQVLQEAVDQGRTITGAAAVAETDLAQSRGEVATSTNNAAAAEQKRAREAEKAAAEQQRAEEKVQREAEQAAQKAAAAQEQYTNAVAGAKQAFADAKVDIKQGLKDTVTDINRTFADTLAEGTIEFHQSELKEEREYQRDLAGIRRDAQRTEAEATRERDFAALADARQDAADAIAERQEDERAANDEQLTEFRQGREAQARDRDIGLREAQIDSQRQLRDAATARDRGIRDAQAALDAQSKQQNQFYNNSLGMAQKYYDSLMSLQSRAMGIGGQAAGGKSPAGQRRAAPAGRGFEDMLNFVMN